MKDDFGEPRISTARAGFQLPQSARARIRSVQTCKKILGSGKCLFGDRNDPFCDRMDALNDGNNSFCPDGTVLTTETVPTRQKRSILCSKRSFFQKIDPFCDRMDALNDRKDFFRTERIISVIETIPSATEWMR